MIYIIRSGEIKSAEMYHANDNKLKILEQKRCFIDIDLTPILFPDEYREEIVYKNDTEEHPILKIFFGIDYWSEWHHHFTQALESVPHEIFKKNFEIILNYLSVDKIYDIKRRIGYFMYDNQYYIDEIKCYNSRFKENIDYISKFINSK